MADAARTAPKPTVAVQSETTASKKAAPASPVVAPAVDGRNGLLYAAGPAMRLGVQCKVVIGPPDDPFEQEADRVAERVTAGGPAMPIMRLPRGRWGVGSGGWGVGSGDWELGAGGWALGEAAQRLAVQREEVEEEDEPAQRLAVQREAAEEEEEPAQRLAVQRDEVEEEDEPAQRLAVQRQPVEDEEPAQLKAGPLVKGVPRVSAQTAATIRNPDAGLPISPTMRSRIEPVVGADLGGARIHTGTNANRAAVSLQARAFTHRHHIFLGSGESAHDLRLMAHEATHVVQQGAASAWGAPPISRAPDQVQRLPAFIAEELNSYARYIPGYTLFTVIVGYNPLLGESVERNATNLLEGLMGLTPAGTYVFDKLSEYGIVQDAFAWVEGELSRLDLSLSRIERTIEEAYEEMDFVRLDPFDYNLAVLRRHFGALYDDVVSFAASLVTHIIELIKEAVIGVVEGLLADNRAWALLKKVLHYDPLRGESVEATTEEILADFLLLIGKETELAQMQERGTLAETAAWLDTQFATFAGLIAELGSLFSAAWDAIQPENLPDLPSNIQTLVANTGSFLQRVWDFASTVATKVLELIKKSLLGWLSSFAEETPGFHLITVILGKNPFTEEVVPRTAENIIRGFITLLPGGNATYQQLAETGTIAQAATRIEGAMAELGISWELISGIFLGIWEGLSIDDLIDPIGAFTRIVAQFGEPISRLFAFIRVVLRELFMLILQLMNFPSDLIGSIISNAMQAFESIKNDPIGFFKNMLAAVKQGFSQFFDNILQHLVGGLVDWLFRGLREAGIEPPADLSLGSVLDFVLQVLGISMERIWQKLAEHVGQETVDRIRGAIDRLVGIWTFVRDVQERGVAAIWEYIEGQISGLWDMVLEQAKNWIMERIVNRAIQWLLSLLDPTGIMPVINSFMAFFRAVQSAIDYLRDILAIINDYVSTIAAVARGEIAPGADRLEQALANAIPVAIGFLANQFGLGRIGDKIAEIVGGIRGLVDRALDWLIGRAVAAVQSLLAALGFGGGAEEAKPPTSEADAEFIFEKAEGAHTIKIRRDLTVFRFSTPVQLTGQESQEELQDVLETVTSVARPSYPVDALGRASGAAGHVEGVKENEGRESLPAVASLPGGLAAYQPGDERGHLIGDRFYGAPVAGNLVPMHTALNNSTFKSYENSVATAYKAEADAGHAVLLHMRVTPNYPSNDAGNSASYRPATVDAVSKLITLKAGSTALSAEETTLPGGAGMTNPSPSVSRFGINTADETTIKAVLRPLNPDKQLVIDTILRSRPFANPDDFAEVVLLRIERSQTISDSRRARIFDALAAIQSRFLPES